MLPSDLTKESLISILLDQKRRQQLMAAMAQEQGFDRPLANRYQEIIGDCQATPDELRAVIAILRSRPYRGKGLLTWLLFHEQIPEDLLLDLAQQSRWVEPLGHRSRPRSLLE